MTKRLLNRFFEIYLDIDIIRYKIYSVRWDCKEDFGYWETFSLLCNYCLLTPFRWYMIQRYRYLYFIWYDKC